MKKIFKLTLLLFLVLAFSGCAELIILGGGAIVAGGFIPSGTELVEDKNTGQITREKINIWGRVGNTFSGTYESLLGDTISEEEKNMYYKYKQPTTTTSSYYEYDQ